MFSTLRRRWPLILLAVVAMVAIACQPTRVILEISNDSGRNIDFVFSEDYIDLRDFGRDYDALNIGDTDTYQGCTECDIAPGEIYRLETPLSPGQSVTLAARIAESESVIFIERFTYEELRDSDWKVNVIDESAR